MSFRRIACLQYTTIFVFVLLKEIWAATHDELAQCGIAGVYKTRQTLLQSPNYPDNYAPNACLDYVIRSPYRCPTKFHIQFLDFLLESSVNCTNDNLAIGLENVDDDMDVLCGQVVGIKKYHTPDGVLRLRFFTDSSPWTTAKGFKILITRLPCERDDFLRAYIDNMDDDDTEEVNAPASQISVPYNLSLIDQHVPYLLPPLFGLNYPNSLANYPMNYPPTVAPNTGSNDEKPCTSSQNQLPQVAQPLTPDQYQTWPGLVSTAATTTTNGQGRQQIISPLVGLNIESCCATSFSQKRFYLSSPGFPRTAFTSLLPTQQRDCQFQIEKASQNVCRLRVVFKFFDFGQTYSGTGAKQGNIEVAIGTSKDVCTEDFLQIDEERFCGCRSGYVYNSFWGLGKKLIRMRMGYSGIPSSGFLLDIFQEDCTGIQNPVPGQLSSQGQNLLPQPQPGGIIQPNNLAGQQSNGFFNSGRQENLLNLWALNGQHSMNGNQQQAALVPPQQIHPIYQQNMLQFSPQNYPIWMPPQQLQLPLVYPMLQYRSARDINAAASQSTRHPHQPLSVVETNSTRKEYYFFDGDEAFARARISDDEPDEPDRLANRQYQAAFRGRCNFDAMDILRLSVDYNWIMKPTCYSPQGRWFTNLFG